MISGTCVLCFSNDIKVFDIGNLGLKYACEKLFGFTISRNFNVCYICCKRLHQFYYLMKLIEFREDSRNQQEFTNTQLKLVNIENTSIPYHIRLEENDIQVKEEKLSDEEDLIKIEFNDVPDSINSPQTEDENRKETKKTKKRKRQKQTKIKKTKEHCCDICDRKYVLRSSLHRHRKTHTTQRPKMKTHTTQRPKMKTHTTQKPKIVLDPVECKICGIRITLKNNLKTHIMMKHTEERPFACDKCDKTYKRSDHLKIHKLTHTDTKPFSCKTCGSTFSRSSTLRAHMAIHSGKVYICDICQMVCSRKGNLKIHILGHLEYKPFQCNECDKSYKTKNILKLHIQKFCPFVKAKFQ